MKANIQYIKPAYLDNLEERLGSRKTITVLEELPNGYLKIAIEDRR